MIPEALIESTALGVPGPQPFLLRTCALVISCVSLCKARLDSVLDDGRGCPQAFGALYSKRYSKREGVSKEQWWCANRPCVGIYLMSGRRKCLDHSLQIQIVVF